MLGRFSRATLIIYICHYVVDKKLIQTAFWHILDASHPVAFIAPVLHVMNASSMTASSVAAPAAPPFGGSKVKLQMNVMNCVRRNGNSGSVVARHCIMRYVSMRTYKIF
jgi:hypothetical protein